MKRRKLIALLVVLVLLIAAIVWAVWGNTALMVSEIEIADGKIPESFSGFRIAQISDLHNAQFGDNNEKLIKMLRETEPDIIVITGDMVDSAHTDIDVAVSFAESASLIASTYYVTGNHEANITDAEYCRLKNGLEEAGVDVLENESVMIERKGEYIKLAGVDDYFFSGSFRHNVKTLSEDEGIYTVLLSHRPEYFELYAESGAELIFSGHAHGGQFRIPFIGGVAAPGQGFFPKYDAGKYTKDDTVMIVSRGLGNSIIPLRINNRPEIVVAELKSI